MPHLPPSDLPLDGKSVGKQGRSVGDEGDLGGFARPAGSVCKANPCVSKAGRWLVVGKSLGIEDWLGDLNQQAGSVLESRGWV